jgi:hypothetical protein
MLASRVNAETSPLNAFAITFEDRMPAAEDR